MGTFPPRECGIATFTQDLVTAMDKKFSPVIKSKIIAMNKNSVNIYNYSEDVTFQIEDTNIQEYMDVAKKINEMDSVRLINIQHEFGIFGGRYGNYLIPFLEIVNKPVVMTFHTVTQNPDKSLINIVQAIADKVAHIIVMNSRAIDILKNSYGVKTSISVVPHGIPVTSFEPNSLEKTKLGYSDNIVLMSFGLMSSGKGYEYVIEALPQIVEKFPNVIYLIVGETHPSVRKDEGETYRNKLEQRVKELGLQKNVKFYNKYLDIGEIIRYLKAADVYVCSNINPDQASSGTLVYAMGCGRAVVSTPFQHAQEVVKGDTGIFAKFNDSKSFADAVIHLLSNPLLKKEMERNAYSLTRHMTWPNVALSYMKLFNKHIKFGDEYEKKLPKMRLNYLTALTNKFGVVQFANHTKPDGKSGYTLDDNARAMIVSCMHYNLAKNIKLNRIRTYLDYIKRSQHVDGKIYNYFDHNKKLDLKQWSPDAQGRTLWATGYLISTKKLPKEIKDEAEDVFNKALGVMETVVFPRSIAFTIIGLYFYNKAVPSKEKIGILKRLADKLVLFYENNHSDEWQWFEDNLTYSNSKIPESLFYAYLATKDKRYLDVAQQALNFLSSVTFVDGVFAPIGHDGWYFKNGKKAHFDQQPVDTSSMVQTLVLASRITRKKEYSKKAITAFQWFLGKNSLNQVVYDESTGGCRDGIGESSVNHNQGAESTISYLMARLSLE